MNEESFEHQVISESSSFEDSVSEIQQTHTVVEFDDMSIRCIDCGSDFIWTVGEQTFFRDKGLQNPPKRCKECKKAKNHRLEAIERAKITGERHKIEVKARCASCDTQTTVPFYPSQGRPVYCRACFLKMNSKAAGSEGAA